jgi:hypothetical protein
MKDSFIAINNKSVASIMPSLKSDNSVCFLGENIYNLPFTLISPLSTDYD